MRIGVDVDGVLADFNTAFIRRVKDVTGRDLFPEGYEPTTWNYPESLGYTREEVSKVWDHVTADPTFWLNLSPYWDAMTVLERLRTEFGNDDVYFITSRPGVRAKAQTEVWLATHSGDFTWNPTVLISSEKGACAKALKLDYYVDDRFENVHDVLRQTGARTAAYLLDRPWNTSFETLLRVDATSDFLDVFGTQQKAA